MSTANLNPSFPGHSRPSSTATRSSIVEVTEYRLPPFPANASVKYQLDQEAEELDSKLKTDLLASRTDIPGRPIVEVTLKKWAKGTINHGKTFAKAKESFQSKADLAEMKRQGRTKSENERIDDGNLEPSYDNEDDLNVARWLDYELTTDELDDIHHHLWWSGRPENIHSLSDQKIRRREIIVTERIRLHLTVDESTVFIKPLPLYLLNYDFWKSHITPSPSISKQSLGFLFSYICLISYPCDLKIAQDLGLTPPNLKWEQWRIIASSTLRHIERHQTRERFLMTPRYKFGELRLGRLNHIMIFCRRNFMRMYYRQHSTYNQYFSRNFAWMLMVVVYLGVVLGAMQVITGTGDHYSKEWNDANYWFSALSIWLIVGVTGMQIVIFVVLFWVYFVQTVYFNKKKGIPVTWRQKKAVGDVEKGHKAT